MRVDGPVEAVAAGYGNVRRIGLSRIVTVSLAVAVFVMSPVGVSRAAPTCVPGWNLVAEVDNSFTWNGLPTHLAAWAGVVQVWKDLTADCTVLRLWVMYNGPDGGGKVTLLGDNIGLTYSVQYPRPFDLYAETGTNAYGDGASWNPDGYFWNYYAHMHYNINARGAEEYWIGVLHPLTDLGTPRALFVDNVFAAFDLPLDFIGRTVYAQVHVYPDRCQCSVTSITIP